MTCLWNGRGEPRVVKGRHGADCPGEPCRGCQPCTEGHCRICGHTHVDGTCAECLAETRDSLRTIGRLCNALPAEVKNRGVEGEAMMLLGPSADPEARGYLVASVNAGRVPAHYLDDPTRCPQHDHIDCRECPSSELHPLLVLGTWDAVWRDALEHSEPKGRVTIAGAIRYLDMQLTYMGGYEHVPFEDFARDVRRCVAHLEAVLHDGEQRETGAPCMKCGTALERTWGKDERADGWHCPRCQQSSNREQYSFAVRAEYEEHGIQLAEKLPAKELAARIGVSPSTIRRWASQLRAAGEDWTEFFPPALPYCGMEDGKRLYRVSTAQDIKRSFCVVPRGNLTQQESA